MYAAKELSVLMPVGIDVIVYDSQLSSETVQVAPNTPSGACHVSCERSHIYFLRFFEF
jgi:hypothetical protein